LLTAWRRFSGAGKIRNFSELTGVLRPFLAQVLASSNRWEPQRRLERAEGDSVICRKCYSEAMTAFPADVRLYLNHSRTRSAAPLSPAPEIAVCLNCGYSQFTIAPAWLSAGWLRAFQDRPERLLKELVKEGQHDREDLKEKEGHPAPQATAQKDAERQDGAPGRISECGRRPSRFRRERWDRHH
jgi:hypothetical protein